MNEQRRKLFNIPEFAQEVVSNTTVVSPSMDMIQVPVVSHSQQEHYTLVSRYVEEPDGHGVILSYLCNLDGVIDKMIMVIRDPNASCILTVGEWGKDELIPISVKAGKNIFPGEVAVTAGMIIEVKWVSGPNCREIYTSFRYRTRE